MSSLDRILANVGSPVDLVKFDIEGGEYEVFSASRRVQEVPWIVSEMKRGRQIERFIHLFPHHCPEVVWVARKMAVVYLRRRA